MSATLEERFQLLREIIARRDFPAAAQLSAVLCQEAPAFAPGWHAAAFVMLATGNPGVALEHIEHALRIDPGHPPFRLLRAECLLKLGRHAEARRAAIELCTGSADAQFWGALGTLLHQVGAPEAAVRAHDRGIAERPADARLLFNRAAVRRFVGDLQGAEADYDRVIALRPDDFEAYLNRSELRPWSAACNHVAQLESLLGQSGTRWRGEVQLCYALAKEYEDIGEYDRSFEVLKRGAMLRRRHMSYDIDKDVATVEWIIEAFSSAAGNRGSRPEAASSSAPIFVIGLPRSGTTLVDRILSSHEAVSSAGERNDFAAALISAVERITGRKPVDRRDLVGRSVTVDFEALGRDYLARVASADLTGCFVDKMPLNYLYCGQIAAALPRAYIVHVERHPMAVCYAMYKTLFQDGYPFSYDLVELARYYSAYRRLMRFWQAMIPERIHTVSYERLILDQVGETRRLLEACHLTWDERCLRFHENPAPTTTASASQVRRPLYDSSVNQWRHYERRLEPLRHALEAAGIDTKADPAELHAPGPPPQAAAAGSRKAPETAR